MFPPVIPPKQPSSVSEDVSEGSPEEASLAVSELSSGSVVPEELSSGSGSSAVVS